MGDLNTFLSVIDKTHSVRETECEVKYRRFAQT